MAKYHKVKTGEDLLKIAGQYGVSPQSIMKANQITRVSAGQGLKIPGITGHVTAKAGMNGQVQNITRANVANTRPQQVQQPSLWEGINNILNFGQYTPSRINGASGVRGSVQPQGGYKTASPVKPLSGLSGSAGFSGGNPNYINIPAFGANVPIPSVGVNIPAGQIGATLPGVGLKTPYFGFQTPAVPIGVNTPEVNMQTPQNVGFQFGGYSSQPQVQSGAGNNGFVMNRNQFPANQAYQTYSMNPNPNASYNALYPYYGNPNQPVGPMTGLGITPTAAPQAPSNFYQNQGGGLVERGIVGDKWEFKNGVTTRAGRRGGGRAGYGQAYQQMLQLQAAAVTPQINGQMNGNWRIGF